MGLETWFRRDLTIDPGSTHTVLASRSRDVLLREHTRVLMSGAARGNGAPHVLAYGTESLTRPAPGRRAQAVLPIERGRLVHPIAMDLLLQELVRRARLNSSLFMAFGMRLGLVAAPHLAAADRSDFLALGMEVSRTLAQVIEAPYAAARGLGLDIHGGGAHMFVDVGGGKSYAAVTSLGGIAALSTAEFGGRDLDEALRRYVERRAAIVIPPGAAESVKIAIGSVYPREQPVQQQVVGVDNRSGFEKKALVDDNEIRDVLVDACEPLIPLIQRCLSETPAELAGDIAGGGVTLLGGGALLSGLPDFLNERLGLTFRQAPDPLNATILGAQALLLDERSE